MKKQMRICLPLILLLCLLLPVRSSQAATQVPVLAFYYAWFDETTWTSGQATDLPAEPYRSADRAVIERHVTQAQNAGINGFVQSWYGPQVENNQTETNFRMLLDIGATRGFQAAVHFETQGPFFPDMGSVIHGLQTLLTTHAQHPAYLRYQGKPVIFFWRQQRFSVDQWVNIRNQLDPNRSTLWIAEGVDVAYQAVFDGHHLYSVAWAASPADQLAKWGNRIRDYAAQNNVERLWVATAMPGYNDTNLPRSDAFAVARRGGAYYRETWQGAIASQPHMLIITSFNEWLEGTQLEPSASYGNLYLDITRELVTGSPPPTVAHVASTATETEAFNAPANIPAAQTPDGPYIAVENITNVREAPTTTAPRLGTLAAGSNVSVIGKTAAGDWWQIDFEVATNGVGWISADVVAFFGDADAVPVVEVDVAAEEPAVNVAEATEAADSEAIADEEIEPLASPVEEVEALPDAPAEEAAAPAEESNAPAEAEAEPVETLGDSLPAETAPGESTAALAEVTEPEVAEQATAEAAAALPSVIAAGRVNIRSGPGLDFEQIGQLPNGTEATVIGRDTDSVWWQIVVADAPDGYGWVADQVVEFVGDTAGVPLSNNLPVIVVGEVRATGPINVRSEPAIDGNLLGGLYLDETAPVLAISPDETWWQIAFDSESGTGWVSAEFVEFTGVLTTVPIFGIGTVTPTPTTTPTPTPVTPSATPTENWPPTYAPTATSVYEATSAALLAERTPVPDSPMATPSPGGDEAASTTNPTNWIWQEWPWGIFAGVLIVLIVGYQFLRRRMVR